MNPFDRFAVWAACWVMVCFAAATSAGAQERPSAMDLFPSETVAWIRTADASLLIERSKQSVTAKAFSDPEIAPLWEDLYGEATGAYDAFAKQYIEADLEDLLRLPQGEIAFGLVNRPDTFPAGLLLADFVDAADVAQQVVDRLQELVQKEGATITTEQLRNDEATLMRDGNNQRRVFAIVRRDTTFVICTDRDVLQSVLDRWDGIEPEPIAITDEDDSESEPNEPPPYQNSLSENPTFTAILKECLPNREEPPQGAFFLDPVGMVEAFGGRSAGVRFAMNMFGSLGVNDIQGFGGALWQTTEQWDSILRGHLLLKNPRSGVVKIARLEAGETKPPSFIPSGMENFLAAKTNPSRMFNEIADLYDRFLKEGKFREMVERNVNSNLGVNLEEDVISLLDGTLCYITGYNESGPSIGSQPALVLGLKDPEAAQELLEKFAEKFSDVWEEKAYGSASYYAIVGPRMRELPPEQRPFSPAVAVLDGHLVLTQSEGLFKQFIEASEGTRERLNESLQYRLIRSRLERLTGGRPFSATGIHDGEPALRYWLAKANSDEAREGLRGMAENNAFFRILSDALDRNELPPVETLLKYNAPSGSVMIDTPTGWHMISFTFRRDTD